MSIKKLNSLIIDNDLDVRMRLRQALLSVVDFGQVEQASNLKEAAERLKDEDGHSYHLLFFAHKLSFDVIIPFIEAAKTARRSEDAAFVMVLPTRAKSNSDIAHMMMSGIDGFLFEPYSVDELVEMTRLAARVSKERVAMREAIAVKFIIMDIIATVDATSRLMSCGYPFEQSMQKLRDICAPLHKLQPAARNAYLEQLVTMFGWVPIPDPRFERFRYKGQSKRVKKRMARLIKLESERQTAETMSANDATIVRRTERRYR